MSTTKTSIFTFDHGQKKLNKAIGVEQSYMDELHEQIKETLKDFLFDENKDMRDDISPSSLVEICANEFSYSQLVIMSSFYLNDKLDGLMNKLENFSKKMKTIELEADSLPPHIKEMLDNLTGGGDTPIDGDTLPQGLKDFLNKLGEDQIDGDGDDD